MPKDIKKPEILLPKSDFIFKLIFGDEHNVEILQSFLKAALDIPPDEYEKIEFVDTHIKKETLEDKEGVLDVLIHTKSGTRVHVEIQAFPYKAMTRRIAFYTSRLIAGQLTEGVAYHAIKKVVCIAILNYRMIKDSERYHTATGFTTPTAARCFRT